MYTKAHMILMSIYKFAFNSVMQWHHKINLPVIISYMLVSGWSDIGNLNPT